MAHFSVLVLTTNKPTIDDLFNILLPWCGADGMCDADGRVPRFDWTEAVRQEAARSGLDRALEDMQLSDAIMSDEADVDPEALLFAVVRDGALIKAVGPYSADPKWDFWCLGGVFTGYLQPGYEPMDDLENMEPCPDCSGTDTDAGTRQTCDRCDGTGCSLKNPTEWKQVGTQSAWGDVDLEGLRDHNAREAAIAYDEFYTIVGTDTVWESRKTVEARLGDDGSADTSYWAQPVFQRLKASGAMMRFQPDQDEFLLPRDAYIAHARDWTLAPMAVVKDGRWVERPDFGLARAADANTAWPATVRHLLADLPPTAWLSVVDCHF